MRCFRVSRTAASLGLLLLLAEEEAAAVTPGEGSLLLLLPTPRAAAVNFSSTDAATPPPPPPPSCVLPYPVPSSLGGAPAGRVQRDGHDLDVSVDESVQILIQGIGGGVYPSL